MAKPCKVITSKDESGDRTTRGEINWEDRNGTRKPRSNAHKGRMETGTGIVKEWNIERVGTMMGMK